MRKNRIIVGIGLIFAFTLSMLLVGCGDKNQSGLTVDEPEITVEYLERDYVKQLLRDGAEHVFGSIELSKNEDNSIAVNIDAKQYVEDDSRPDGFYIEDRNYNLSTVLAAEARCTFIPYGVSLPQIMDTQQFAKAYEKDLAQYDGGAAESNENRKLYDIYIMGDQIELILEKYIP